MEPAAKVTTVPTRTYHVKARCVKNLTPIIVAMPAVKPASAPFSLARLFHVPSRNTPSIPPYVIDAIVSPATSTGPQRTSPTSPSTSPQASVLLGDRRSQYSSLESRESGGRPGGKTRERARMLEDASEFSEPLAF